MIELKYIIGIAMWIAIGLGMKDKIYNKTETKRNTK
tara:strand:- start:20950 stop:21057 length:108 start_codon:yes stop_codon:yes gene_type:complete